MIFWSNEHLDRPLTPQPLTPRQHKPRNTSVYLNPKCHYFTLFIHFKLLIFDKSSLFWGTTRLTLTRPLRKKLRTRWFFDVSKVEESSFFKSDLTDPLRFFDAHLFENINQSPFSFHFSVVFILRSCLWVRWFYSLFERMKRKKDVYSHKPIFNYMIWYKKVPIFCRIRWVSDDPQFFAQRACEGVNRSGAWGLTLFSLDCSIFLSIRIEKCLIL